MLILRQLSGVVAAVSLSLVSVESLTYASKIQAHFGTKKISKNSFYLGLFV
jgi:hypothetical protein